MTRRTEKKDPPGRPRGTLISQKNKIEAKTGTTLMGGRTAISSLPDNLNGNQQRGLTWGGVDLGWWVPGMLRGGTVKQPNFSSFGVEKEKMPPPNRDALADAEGLGKQRIRWGEEKKRNVLGCRLGTTQALSR